MWAEMGEENIWESSGVKLVGVTIDNKINFDSHVGSICLKA